MKPHGTGDTIIHFDGIDYSVPQHIAVNFNALTTNEAFQRRFGTEYGPSFNIDKLNPVDMAYLKWLQNQFRKRSPN